MPSDLVLKAMNTTHRIMLKLTGNKLGASVIGMPSLELTTIGRKSGQPRSVMLTSPLQQDDAYVVVASRGGDDIHPAFFLNLRDNPDVEVQVVVADGLADQRGEPGSRDLAQRERGQRPHR